MLNLNIKLEKNKNYINSGNIFSKLIILKDFLEKSNDFIIIVENEKKLNNYLKISEFLGLNINKLENISDYVNLIYNGVSSYITTKDFYNIDLGDLKQFEYHNLFKISKGDSIEISELTKKLNEFGYKFSEYNNKNTFKIVGDILSITDSNEDTLSISFWGETIEDIIFGNISRQEYFIGKISELNYSTKFNNEILIPVSILTILDDLDFYSSYDKLIDKNFDNYIVFNSLSNNSEYKNLGITDLHIENIDDFKLLLEDSKIDKYIFSKNRKTISNFIELNNLSGVKIYDTNLTVLKSFQTSSCVFITDDNISRIFIKKRVKRKLSKNLDLMMQIKPGDFVVHIDHGIGIFKEVIEKELSGIKKEYINLEYKGDDKLFVPITEVGRVSKYVGSENPKLTGLSTKEWEKKLKKVGEDIEIIAGELLEAYAKRKLRKGFSFGSFPKQEAEFANSFDYVYTEDQLSVIGEIYKEMESENPMDRLLSGDVGFGKTEIAFASIYKAIINNKQAVLISPLVVLAYEHYEKSKERFEKFPFNIEVVTRFEKPSVIKVVLEKLKQGKIDLVIGTHRLLSEDVSYKDLGLIVIDEEHKFGVKDKEKIKKFKGEIDILSMSATPIPRSLNMALNGIKSMSMLTTPPVGRMPIQTIVSSFDERVIFDAGKREFDRGGQLFFIHNRVATIDPMAKYLEELFPGKKVIVAHGQLSGDLLEKRIIEFKRKQGDILLATTVVENGIDFSNVNTIFINESQNFGISQIHQLRGRVGRSDKKGYCYLLFKKDKIKEDAAKRLKTIVDYSHLGAGFELAIKDLEIRGGGDILGIRQSGQGQDIGVNLFLEMLENRVEEMKNSIDNKEEVNTGTINTSIELNIGAYIDEKYFSSELDKINFYREIESLNNLSDLENIINDFKAINSDLPKTTINFFNLLRLKIKASKYKILFIKKVGINYQIDFIPNIKLEELKNFLDLDKDVKFVVTSGTRLRSATKNFENEEKFLEYVLLIFDGKILNKKIRLKRKG